MRKLRVEDIDVDDIWRALGPLGKYQCKNLLSFMFVLVSWAIHPLTIVFIGYRPSFHCRASPNDSLLTNITGIEKVYKECETVTYENISGSMVESSVSCRHGWEYDITVEQSFVTEWDFVCEKAELAELTQTLMSLGMIVGNFIFPAISDRVGRKPVLVTCHVALFGIVLGTAFSGSYVLFVVFRILTGFVSQGFLAGTTLSLENLPTEIRHYSEVFSVFVWASAICLISPIAYALKSVSWRYLQIAYALLAATSLFQWWITDESLRWVLAKGKVDKAREIIRKACKLNNKSYEEVLSKVGLGHIEHESPTLGVTDIGKMTTDKNSDDGSEFMGENGAVENDVIRMKIETQSYSLIDIVKNLAVLKISLIIWYIWVCDSFVYNGLYMISSDLYGDRYLNFFLSALVEYPAGSLNLSVLQDRVGRKPVLVTCHVALFGIVLGTAFSGSYVLFVIFRILTGFVSQGFLAGTTLSLENLPTEIRHYSEVFSVFVWASAICLISPIAYALKSVSWRYLQIAYALLAVTSLFQWWITDESLRWVLAKGKVDKAREIIRKACKLNNKSYEEVLSKVGLGHIEHESPIEGVTDIGKMTTDKNSDDGSEFMGENGAVENDVIHMKIESQSYNLLDIVKNLAVLKISLIIWYIWVCDSFVYNGLYMISSDLYGDRYLNFFLSALVEYPAGIFEFICFARIGRKWTCLICHIVAAVGLIVATALIYSAGDSTSLLATGTAFTLIGKMGITGASSSLFLLTPELYPTNVRTSALGVASVMGRIGAKIAPFARNISHSIKWLPSRIFAAMCIVTVVLLAFVPETNGVELPQTMEELAEWYRGNKFEMKIGKNIHIGKIEKETKKETYLK